MATTTWQTTKAAGVACGVCGKRGTCTVAPDGTAFKCWKDGGRVTQMNPKDGTGGTGYVGKAHRRKPAAAKSPAASRAGGGNGGSGGGRLYPDANAAAEAARLAVETVTGHRATAGGTWTYTVGGAARLIVLRFDLPDGDKQYRPVHPTKKGWRAGDPPGPLPLYRLDELRAAETAVTVYVTEGEKACDAARAIGLVAVTSAHGSSAADKTDWTPLAGRDVVVLPDADPPGAAYARAVATALVGLDPPAAVRVLALPDLPTGGDVVEYVDGCGDAADPADVRGSIEALAAAVPPEDPAGLVGGPVLTCMADVQPRAVDWLWDGRFALGRQSLIVGVPGGGKSFLTCEMAAHVTTGTPWPDGSPCPRGSVLLICAEDDPADTIRPRLDACGADVSKVHILRGVRRVSADGDADEVMFKLADVKELERALRQIRDCLLVVVDPIGSFLGGGADAHRDNEVRGVLAPLSLLAERYGVAVVLVAHRRKSSAGSADESTLGSRAFTGLARAVWHLSRDPDDPGRRLLLPGKNNLAAASTGLAFRLVGGPTPAVEWEDAPVAMTADDALVAERRRMSGDDGGSGRDDGDARDRGRAEPLRPGPKAVARTAAEHWLTALLANGGMRVGRHEKPEEGTIAAAARAAGFSWGTLRRAREALGIVPVKAEFNDGWYWQLPPADDGDEPPAAAAAEVDAGPTRPPGGGAAACAPSGQPAHLAAGGPPMPPAGLPDVAGPRPGCAPSGGALFAHELATRAGEGARDVQVAAPSGASAGTEVAA